MVMKSAQSLLSSQQHSRQQKPETSSVSAQLTNSEIVRLQRNKKESLDLLQKVFQKTA